MNNQGKTVLLGQSSIFPDGEWVATKQYPRLYFVRHGNASYISRQESVGIEPNVSPNWQNYWMMVAADGTMDLTPEQVAALDSGIDSTKVAKISTNETAISEINGKIPSAASSSNKLVDTTQMQAFAMPITTKYGANLSLAFNNVNGQLTAQLKDQDGNNLGQTQTVTIDLTSLENTINNILALIPPQASSDNQLADKDFVNSSISTNTAHFIGTFNSLAELEAYSGTVTNNDYANVIRTVDGQTYYDRYTYNGNTEEWEFNFTVNSTSFTAVQWAAINSGITQSLVATYSAHIADKNNPHEVTKAQVGLGDVDNTSDLNKPVSAAQRAALNALQQGVENGDIVAGIAKQIQNVSPESGSYQEKPFLFQGTGTDSNTTETPTAPIAKHLELRGNTVVFNQLIDYKSNNFTLYGVTFTRSGNGWVANGTADSTHEISGNYFYNSTVSYGGIPVISDHKYLMGASNIKTYEYFTDGKTNAIKGRYIKTASADGYYAIAVLVEENIVYDNVYFELIFTDLTKMFGAGKEPTSVLQFNRLFPLPYYAYNAGELKSCQSNKLITTGYNQFETLNQFIRVVAGQTYRLMYWNGTALAALTSGSIEEYNGTQTLIQTTTYDNLSDLHTVDNSYPDNGDKGIKLTDETQYVKIVNSNNTNILFNLAWDGSRSDFETFVKHEYTLPDEELKSARNVYDSYYPDGTKIQRVDSLDLGQQTYTYNETYKVFYFDKPLNMKGITSNVQVFNGLCPIYDVDTFNNIRYDLKPNANMGIAVGFIGGSLRVIIRNDNYTDTALFKTAMSGVILYYELAESITTTGQQTFPENIEVDDFGTMQFTTSETESASNPIIPQGNRFFYPADYALLIDDLHNYTDGDVNVLAKKSDLPTKITQSTDLTPTTQTLTLTANTRYALGTLTALSLTFPASGNDGDEIIIEFISGSTATTLTRDTTNAIYNFNSVGSNVFVEFNAQYKVSISKWVVYSAETTYGA